MTVNNRCAVCRNADLRRVLELGWNAKMLVSDLVHAFGGVPSHAVIAKHLKEHTDGAWSRDIPVEDARPMRLRVLAIQQAQVEAIERQMAMAQQEADEWNERHKDDEDFFPRDPSHYFDILSKDMQAAVSSILKAQGLTDKRESKVEGQKVDLFRLMLGDRGGLAPASLRIEAPTTEGEFVEVSTDGDSL
jgi:hypothetical protein